MPKTVEGRTAVGSPLDVTLRSQRPERGNGAVSSAGQFRAENSDKVFETLEDYVVLLGLVALQQYLWQWPRFVRRAPGVLLVAFCRSGERERKDI